MRDLLINFSPAGRAGVVMGVIAAAVGAWAAIAEGGLAGAILVAALLGVLVGGFWIGLAPQVRRNRLARVGVAAEATILSVGETGWTLQGNYGLARLRLQVEPPDGGAPCEATARRTSAGSRCPPTSRASVLQWWSIRRTRPGSRWPEPREVSGRPTAVHTASRTMPAKTAAKPAHCRGVSRSCSSTWA